MYNRTFWLDHVVDQHGQIIQQGTLMDQTHFNKIEEGISDVSTAHDILAFRMIQDGMNNESELHTLTLSMDALPWPFNNKANTIALNMLRENTNYSVEVNVLEYSGGRLGNIRVMDRAKNGFKILHDGSATTVKVAIRVSGGITDPAVA